MYRRMYMLMKDQNPISLEQQKNILHLTKTVEDSTLIAVVIQSYAFDSNIKKKGWEQNFTLNGETASGEHYALGRAADKVLAVIAALARSESNV